MSEAPTITCLAPWYGSNRMLGPKVGEALKGCEWVGIPFAGGMAEVAHIEARTVLVSDLHRHVVNLAWVCADEHLGPLLYRRLRRRPFHPAELSDAQCAASVAELGTMPDIDAAEAYFVSQWMGRSGKAGTRDEFKGNLPIRWDAGGGDSAKRYQSAVRSINAWRRVLARCTFSTLDAFEFLGKCHDKPKHGVYVDPPFPGPGDKYAHNCGRSEDEQRAWHTRLHDALVKFKTARVVCRFYDHPMIQDLYGSFDWEWRYLEGGRTSANKEAPEVLIVRNG